MFLQFDFNLVVCRAYSANPILVTSAIFRVFILDSDYTVQINSHYKLQVVSLAEEESIYS